MSILEKHIFDLISCLETADIRSTGVIPWSSPVPSFGDLQKATLATLGLNPSNREFMDQSGNELVGDQRRFHTLRSLMLQRWRQVRPRHIDLIAGSCRSYFVNNPYDAWFKHLDGIISGSGFSYYGGQRKACHLDLIPYATSDKWMALSSSQKLELLKLAGNSLGRLLRSASIQVLILNGASVIRGFEKISGAELASIQQSSWTLCRNSARSVPGYSYRGWVRAVGHIKLPREVLVLGFNHNIQSSFGVTKDVKSEISEWISEEIRRG